MVDVAVHNSLLVTLTLILGVFLLAIGRKLLGVDSWLTLMAGREIVAHGLPGREVLTTIPAGRQWVDQQWLAQLIFYGLDRAGGLGLALVFHALMVTSAIAIAVTASRIRGASARMTLLAAFVCLVMAPWSWQLRAQSIALPLFALTLALVATDERQTARRTYLVFPLLVLWANVHGSVVLGAMIVALVGFVGLIGIARRQQRPPSSSATRPLLFLAAPWACIFVSPYATDLVGYYRVLLFDGTISRYITEWQAPRPHGYFLVFFVVAVAVIAVAAWKRRSLSLLDLAVLALTLAGALRSVRAVVWFSIALALLLPLALDGIVRPPPSPPVHRRVAALLMGTLAAVLAAAALFVVTRDDAWFERDWSAGASRVAARAASSTSRPAAVWSSGLAADWLLWKEPSLRGRVAWDARFELLTGDELREIVRFNDHRGNWRQTLAGYPILVLDREREAEQLRELRRDPGTRVIYADRSTVVLRRPDG